MQFIVNKVQQIGIDAETHDEALRAVMAGSGDILAANYSINIRPPAPPQNVATHVMVPTQTPESMRK